MSEHNDNNNQIYHDLLVKDTAELISIWNSGDRSRWSDDSFSMIEKILEDRLAVPARQDQPENQPGEKPADPPKPIGSSRVGMILGSGAVFILIWSSIWTIAGFLTLGMPDSGWIRSLQLTSVFMILFMVGGFMLWDSITRQDVFIKNVRRKIARNEYSLRTKLRLGLYNMPEEYQPFHLLWMYRIIALMMVFTSIGFMVVFLTAQLK